MLDAALAYAARGWRVFPLHSIRADDPAACTCARGAACENKAKHPRTSKGVWNATTDRSTIRRYWKKWPDANIGIACGDPRRLGLVVVDLDGPEARETIARWAAEGRELPPTWTVSTGRDGGGRHLYYLVRPGLRNHVKIAPGIDVRGWGGYVVAPPSLHASGRRYQWESLFPTDGPAVLPEWLFELLDKAGSRGRGGAHSRQPAAPSPPGLPALPGPGEQAPTRAYALAALRREAEAMRVSRKGERHNRLFAAAAALGEIEATGALQQAEIERELTAAALAVGLDDISRTVADGITRGRTKPRWIRDGGSVARDLSDSPITGSATAGSATTIGEARDLREALRPHQPEDARCRSCGFLPRGGRGVAIQVRGSESRARGGGGTCGSVWGCPVCGAVEAVARAAAIQAFENRGVLGAIEIDAGLHDDPRAAHDAATAQWRKLTSGRASTNLRSSLGVIDTPVRIVPPPMRLTDGRWHARIIAIVLSTRAPSPEEIVSLAERAQRGGCASLRYRRMPAVEAGALVLEAAHPKHARAIDGERHPWEIARSAIAGSASDGEIWREYVGAMHGAHMITGLPSTKTEKPAVDEPDATNDADGWETICFVPEQTWSQIISGRDPRAAVAQLLACAVQTRDRTSVLLLAQKLALDGADWYWRNYGGAGWAEAAL